MLTLSLAAGLRVIYASSMLQGSGAGLQAGEYEIRIWGLNEGVETPIGQSKFKIESASAPVR